MFVDSFFVAGVSFGERQEVLREVSLHYIRSGEKMNIVFRKEPENEYDGNAIAVAVELEQDDWYDIGYVPKALNVDFLKIIDSGKLVKAKLASVGRPNAGAPLGAKVLYEVDEELDEDE